MAGSTKLRLRNTWFQVHKWLGILLAILIIPVSLSGSALVWHDWLDETVNPERQIKAEPELRPSQFAAVAQRALQPGERILSLAYDDGGGPVLVTAARPASPGETRPVRSQLWLHPVDGRVVDRGASDSGVVRTLHVLHGSLMVPGVGRQIVGWVGVALLLSAMTGLWLWWPLEGSWTRGLRWRRHNSTNDNLHHTAGFWIALPLAMLSFTGVWISFPPFFAQISGAPAPAPRSPPAAPLAETRLSADRALALAYPAGSWEGGVTALAWPTAKSPEWKVGFRRNSPGTSEVAVNDRTGEVTPPSPPRPETTARTMRRWHDGTGMGPVWQTIIFVGGILPALLAVTGIIMWLRTRRWRADLARRRKSANGAA